MTEVLFENSNLRIIFKDPHIDVYILNYEKFSGGTLHYIQGLHKESLDARIYVELIKEVNK